MEQQLLHQNQHQVQQPQHELTAICPEDKQPKPNTKISTWINQATTVQLFRHQNYSIRRLLPKDKEAALHLLAKQFSEQQPLTNAFARQFNYESSYFQVMFRQQAQYKKKDCKRKYSLSGPETKKSLEQSDKQKLYQKFISSRTYNLEYYFFSMFINNAIQSGLSVGIFDMENNEKMVGVNIAKELSYIPPGFEERYMKDLNFMSSIVGLQEELIHKADPEHQNLLRQKGVIPLLSMDIFAVAIHKEHMGKKLLHKMVKGNQQLALKQGYQFAFCYVSNFKTGIALQKQNYTKISEIDAKQFQYRGVKPFVSINQEQRISSLWLKKLQ